MVNLQSRPMWALDHSGSSCARMPFSHDEPVYAVFISQDAGTARAIARKLNFPLTANSSTRPDL